MRQSLAPVPKATEMAEIEKITVVTKKTPLEELVERFNSRDQARFYLEHMGASFGEYSKAHEVYVRAVDRLRAYMPKGVKNQFIERGFLPTFQFGEHDLVVTVGPDGLVINTAKYLTHQPILAVNPDPARVDGILIPFAVENFGRCLERMFSGQLGLKKISMAKVELNDGQKLYAVNDLFIGAKTHVSARYGIQFESRNEVQSSSGIIVSTGAGCTGWLQSIVKGSVSVTRGVTRATISIPKSETYRLAWESEDLYFTVREPFTSKTSMAGIVFGKIRLGEFLYITSQMPDYGVIFSDGIEKDFIAFNSGAIAKVSLAERKANLIVPAVKFHRGSHHTKGGLDKKIKNFDGLKSDL